MIRLAGGRAVSQLLARVQQDPIAYSRVVICTPFMDSGALDALVAVGRATATEQVGFTLVSTALGLKEARRRFGDRGLFDVRMVSVTSLHAKIYLARGRRAGDTMLFVGSVNLTGAGLWRNVEAGVLATPSTDEGARIVSEAESFLDGLIRASSKRPRGSLGRVA